MTTTTIPPIVAKIAGVDLAERVQEALPAAVELYLKVAGFAEGEHGEAIRDYWAAHDDLHMGNVIDEYREFDRVNFVLRAMGVHLRAIHPTIVECLMDVFDEDDFDTMAAIIREVGAATQGGSAS